MSSREVKYAVLHGIIKVPDAGQVGPTVSSTASASTQGYKMTLVDDELVIEVTNSQTKRVVTIYIPKSSISHFQLKDK